MNSSPQTYNEWIEALLGLGCSVEGDATKLSSQDAERLANVASRAPKDATLTLYNCGNIPYDLRAPASIGRGRVTFRL